MNQAEHIPRIMRLMDSDYLTNDYVVSATAGYGVRYFYSLLCAALARILTLPVTYFLLTCLQNILVALVTLNVARRLNPESRAAPLLGCVLVMSLESLRIGQAGYFHRPEPDPAILVMPLALLSLWLGIARRPVSAALVGLPAALVHPPVGLQCAMLGIVADGAVTLCRLPRSAERQAELHRLARAGAGGAIVLLFYLAFWFLPLRGGAFLTSAEFIEIHSRLRLPHHIIPSSFPLIDWLALVAFLSALLVVWRGFRTVENQATADRLLAVVGLVLLLWLGGWVFVEKIPSRLWASMHVYRLALILKWVGLMLLGRAAAGALAARRYAASALILAGPGRSQPFAMLWAQAVDFVQRRARPAVLRWVAAAVGVAGAFVIFRQCGFSRAELVMLVASGVMAACLLWLRRAFVRVAAVAVIGVMLVGAIFVNRQRRLPVLGALLEGSQPGFTLADLQAAEAGVARFAAMATPEGAVFVVPPLAQAFRLLAGRAVVVDYKNFPFSDSAMVEWRDRLRFCYGRFAGWGFGAAAAMDRNYHEIPDYALAELAQRYGADYAVLYPDTPTSFAELYADARFKLVRIGDRPADGLP